MLDKLPITEISKKSLAATQKNRYLYNIQIVLFYSDPEPKNKKPLQNINYS